MTLEEDLAGRVSAGFSGLWVRTDEPDEAVRAVAGLCKTRGWPLAVWDVGLGLRSLHGPARSGGEGDPLAPLSAAPPPDGKAALTLLVNYHRYLASPEVVQSLQTAVLAGKAERCAFAVLGPVVELPPELAPLFVVLDHPLPSRDELGEIARGVATGEGELPKGRDLERVLDAAAGLTRYAAEGAFALSVVRHGRVLPEVLLELKAQTLRQEGLLTLDRGGCRFRDLGGLEALKGFCLRLLSRTAKTAKPRGVLLLSPPGCGKTAFARALGAEAGRPTLSLDVGRLLGGLVGESERNLRRALATAEAMSPCVLFLDELEKGLAGTEASGRTDGGVTARLFGSLLTWLSEHESDVFVVGTANDVSRLPPELSRAGRFDGVWFLDLPGRAQLDAIWGIHREAYGLDRKLPRPPDDGWSGAEVASCCRLAVLLGVTLVDAAKHVVPVSVSAAEQVQRLRRWAAGRCLDAEAGGVCRSSETNGRRRHLAGAAGTKPSLN
jgi:hypothetical protein